MQEILPYCYYFPNALSWLEQKKLVKFYLQYQNQLYQPVLKTGSKMNLLMACFGWHWSAKNYKYYKNRIDVDAMPVLAYPKFLNEMIAYSLFDTLKLWDVLILNYYNNSSKLGLHQDNSEDKETLQSGYPILSISIGASCIFQIGGFKRNEAIQEIQLNSGDILMMGGESRLRFHGVKQILSNSDKAPFSKFLNGGRINFTLRKK